MMGNEDQEDRDERGDELEEIPEVVLEEANHWLYLKFGDGA
jgi:hypothetical protein